MASPARIPAAVDDRARRHRLHRDEPGLSSHSVIPSFWDFIVFTTLSSTRTGFGGGGFGGGFGGGTDGGGTTRSTVKQSSPASCARSILPHSPTVAGAAAPSISTSTSPP